MNELGPTGAIGCACNIGVTAVAGPQTDDKDESQWFDCICGDCDHSMRFSYMGSESNEEPPFLAIEMNLSQMKGFFGRLWTAIKYVLWKNDKCRYGDFEECLLQPSDIPRLRHLLDLYDADLKRTGFWQSKNGYPLIKK